MPDPPPRCGNMCVGRHCSAGYLRDRRCAPVSARASVRHVCRILPTDCTRGTSLLPPCLGRQRGMRSGRATPSSCSSAATAPSPCGGGGLRLASVKWARVPIGLQSEFGSTHPAHLIPGRGRSPPNGTYKERLATVRCRPSNAACGSPEGWVSDRIGFGGEVKAASAAMTQPAMDSRGLMLRG